MKRFWLILAAFLGMAIQAVPASAAVQYTLNCNAVACGSSGNYGTVTLTQSGAVGAQTVHVAVALASSFTFGAKDVSLFFWNGTGDTDSLNVTNIVSNASTFAVQGGGANGSYTPPPSPFGVTTPFDYTMNRNSNASGASTLSFDVTKNGGLTLANFATGNDGGAFYFGALIKGSGDAFFVASNQEGIQVPEPGTLTLSIAGLAGLAGLALVQRRRYRALPR